MQDPVGFCWILVKIKDRTHHCNTWNLQHIDSFCMLSRVLHQNDLLQYFWNQDNYSSQEMVLVQTGYSVDCSLFEKSD